MRTIHSRHLQTLSRLIRAALGPAAFASVAAAATLTACTNQVTYPEGDGDGDGGAGGVSTVTSTSTNATGTGVTSSSTGWECPDWEPTPQFECNTGLLACNENLTYVCAAIPISGECADYDDTERLQQLCDEEPDACIMNFTVNDLLCGPDPNVTQECCYHSTEFVASGRPFFVDEHARSAESVERDDWCVELLPELEGLRDAERQALCRAWTDDALAEHASIASFARFAMHLLALGAPADLVLESQRAMSDEIKHARLCFGMASAYGDAPCGPGAIDVEGSLADASDRRAIAVAAVVEGCVGETISALLAMAARDRTEDAAAKRVLDRIARDEARHAMLAWRFVRWVLATADPQLVLAIGEAFAGAVPPHAADDHDDAVRPDVLQRHGRLVAAERNALSAAALRDVIRPCAGAMLAKARTTQAARAA